MRLIRFPISGGWELWVGRLTIAWWNRRLTMTWEQSDD